MQNRTATIRAGVVGCGAVVEQLYVPILREFERKRWVAVSAFCDPQPDRRERILRHFRRAHGYAKHEDMFESERIDLAILASPPAWHCSQAEAALARGCHVFCEKPMTPTVLDGERLAVAARKSRGKVAIGMPRRFHPSFCEVAGLVRDGLFGDQVAFTFREGAALRWPAASDSLFRRDKAGGGVLLDKGSHMLDQLLVMFGRPQVLSCQDDGTGDGVEANFVMQLSFPRAQGLLQGSWESPLNNGLHISGSKMEVWLDLLDIGGYRRRAPGDPWKEIAATRTWPSGMEKAQPARAQPRQYDQCFRLQLIAMLRSIEYNEPLPVTVEDGLTVIRCIEEAYQMAQPVEFGWLDAAEREQIVKRHWRAKMACASR